MNLIDELSSNYDPATNIHAMLQTIFNANIHRGVSGATDIVVQNLRNILFSTSEHYVPMSIESIIIPDSHRVVLTLKGPEDIWGLAVHEFELDIPPTPEEFVRELEKII